MDTMSVRIYFCAVTTNAIALGFLAHGWSSHDFNRPERAAIVLFTGLSIFLWIAYFALKKRNIYR